MEDNKTINKVITIDVTQAVSSLKSISSHTEESTQTFNSLGDAKKHIDKLRASLLDLTEGSDEYIQRCKEITDEENKLAAARKASANSVDDLEGSYNALNKQMNELKKAWKATNDEAKRDELGKQISDINDQLKGFDASIGNFQRNVGNYGSVFKESFDKMTDGLDKAIPGTRQVYDGITKIVGGFKALKATMASNPVTAILTVAATLVAGIAANWDKIKDKIGLATAATRDYNTELSNSKIQQSEILTYLEHELAIRKINGEADFELQKERIKSAEIYRDKLREQKGELEHWISLHKDDFAISKKQLAVKQEALANLTTEYNAANETLNSERRKLEIYQALEKKQAEIAAANKTVKDDVKEISNVLDEITVEDIPISIDVSPINIKETKDIYQSLIDANKYKLDAMKEYNKEYYDLLAETTNMEWLQQESRLKAEGATNIEIEAARKAHQKRISDIEEAAAAEQKTKLKQTILDYSDVAASIGGLVSQITDFWQTSIEEREKNGEITSEQAKKEFEENKKMQIASAVLTGLAGVAAALASPVAMAMGPAGWIAAGVQAATIAVSTAAQVAKIKQMKYDSVDTSSVAYASTTATPTEESTTYTPRYTANVTGQSENVDLANAVKSGQSDTRVYIVESDIQKAGKRVQVRESESTF